MPSLCDARSRGAGGRACVEPDGGDRGRRAHGTNRVERDERSEGAPYEGAPAEIPADVAPPGTPNGAEAVAFSPDGRLLAAAFGDGHIRLWDAKSGEAVGEPLGAAAKDLEGVAQDVTFSPTPPCSPRPLSILTGRGAAVAWRVSDGKELFTLNIDDGYGRGSAVAFTPDGKLLATGGGTGEIKLWDASTVSSQGRRSRAPRVVLALDFDLTSERLVSTG